ncbi:hypothetical protein B296_00034620 [Ensete ventricosum]|uniref:Leucine zipper homeobox-associated domain-containing protein n=1 Tax=Ensete ventricosum TaxID=4639 RepID=A0A426Y105_ENSVE|nr:hypothetical protein B296_00034620 [Ensete ventricosum]
MEEGAECDTSLTLSVGGACASIQFHALVPFHHQQQEEEEEEEACSRKNTAGGTRKKLRLSHEQQALLEGNFREHTTLAPVGSVLNLHAKKLFFVSCLKQMEAELETLKKYRERLCEENRRLKREVEELRRSPGPRATTLAICSACSRKTSCRAPLQRQGGTNGGVSTS